MWGTLENDKDGKNELGRIDRTGMDNTGRLQESGGFQGLTFGGMPGSEINFAGIEKVTRWRLLWIPTRRMAVRGQDLDAYAGIKRYREGDPDR